MYQPSSEIATERVAAEQEVAERRREGFRHDGERTAGRDDRRGDGKQDDKGKPQEAECDARITQEAVPEAVHQPTLMRGSRMR